MSGAARRLGRIGTVALAAAGGIAIATAATSVLVARTVVTPPSRRKDDIAVLAVDPDAGTVTLSATEDSRLPGEYGFWFSSDTGYARIGEILSSTPRTVMRRLLAVERGDLGSARRGRLSGWLWLGPEGLGLPYEDVRVPTPLGDAPAWRFPAETPTGRWVIQVHGRAVRRAETLRAVPVFREAGYDSLLVSYRNDGEAPRSTDYRFALGDREWLDVEAGMRYALEHGATEIVLMGWSMGGATVLQALTRSPLSRYVTGVALESPVVDWIATLDYQGRLLHLPAGVRWGVYELLKRPWGGLLTGLAAPIDLGRLDFVARARELDRPILLLHSDDDGFVPATASHALAQARPDLVTLERFEGARHTKLWNYDRERFEGAIRRWLEKL